MKTGPSVGVLVLVAALAGAVQCAQAEHRRDRDHARVEQYRDGPCRVKEITDYGYYRKAVRCPGGRGKTWRRGDWHRDCHDGACRIRIDASREVFDKEKVCRTRNRYHD